MAKAGHDVHLFTVHFGQHPGIWEGVKLHDATEIYSSLDSSYDTVISWSEPDLLRYASDKSVRVCYQMLNDWSYCVEGFHDVTDIFITVSNLLKEHVTSPQKMKYPSLEKWHIVPLGCSPELYEDKRVPRKNSVDKFS